MKFNNVALHSIRLSLPEEIWTSEYIENQFADTYQSMRLSVGRLELMTGIRERRVWSPDFLPSVEAGKVGKALLDDSGIAPGKIGLLMHCGVCRVRLEPATASYVHHQIGLPESVQIMDLSNACLGFINGMIVAASMIESGLIEAALIVTAENSRGLLENTIRSIRGLPANRNAIKPYFANLTIGSGAVAALLCHSRLSSGIARLQSAVVRTDSSHHGLCEGGQSDTGAGHEMLTDSESLLIAGIRLASATWADFKSSTGWTDDSIRHTLCHQVGKMHQAALYDTLGIDRAKDFSIYPELGNMGSAALPATLSKAVEANLFNSGDRFAMLGIGSGITSMMLALEWQ